MSSHLLNTKFESQAVVEGYETFIWTERFDSVGDFELHFPVDSFVLSNYLDDFYIWDSTSKNLMIIEDSEPTGDAENGLFIKVSGRSLESILQRRIIWNQTNLTGNLQDAVERILNENIISPPRDDRKIPNFVFKRSNDPNVTGLAVDTQFHGETVYTAIAAICQAYGIGFRVNMLTDGVFTFELYAGADRSYTQMANQHVVFSPNFDNLADSKYFRSKRAYTNVTLIGGEGEGSDRRYAEYAIPGTNTTGLNRRELFTDAGSVSSKSGDLVVPQDQYIAMIIQKGIENLAENSMVSTFDGKVEMTDALLYNVHYFLGDIVQLEDDYGNQSRSRITEFIKSDSVTGKDAYPTLSSLDI